ncbi:MAG: aldo/keto reductase [Alphaproteobacteria bacterium]|nr:aldo/keto reductase [Alphaproteobacteria bacterium]
MRTQQFGRTGLDVSEIVLGGGIVGGILILADEATRQETLRRTVAAGINWIDTAESYGNGVSETVIGRYLASLLPRPQISSKVRLAPEERADLSGAIERHLEASLKRLGRDSIELYQLHNQLGDGTGLMPVELVLKKGGVADSLDRLQGRGLFRAMGMTALGETAACLRVIESGRFQSAQVYYNLLNPSAAWAKAPKGWSAQDFSGLIDACKRHGMAVMNIRALAGGALASPVRHGREAVVASGSDLDREAARAAAVWSALGSDHGTPAQTALRFTLANAGMTTRVFGVAELGHFDEALAAVARGPLPAEAIGRVEALWRTDFGLPPLAR